MAESPGSSEVTFRLSRCRQSVPRSRAALHAVLGGWGVNQDVLESAELVLSELVTNALRVRVPSDRQVGVRIARSLEDGLLRLEVSDAGSGRPEVQAPGDDETGGRGLLLVQALAHRWGVDERACGIGKTVWAELKAPDIVPEPVGRKVAAVMVRPGQRVRVWGEWHAVRTVRTEPYAAGGLAVELGLDKGPALRVHAAEPLTVLDGGVPSVREGGESTPG
ncbi:PAS sensor protein [Streptomyces qaidamensis]|uniref:PAS sensor protein n=1 Tax=Streptomyces qaidamensis TaxID=1783515 RepID=A0A143BYE3_9ACTN|nr:ATP-binding protein [Streptomyces qaidamensis]AMW10144.1 PAS sensor protein [Streptomyces qaidamensis]